MSDSYQTLMAATSTFFLLKLETRQLCVFILFLFYFDVLVLLKWNVNQNVTII